MSRMRAIHLAVLLIATLWLCWLFAAPWLMAAGHSLPGLVSYRVFALLCHQQIERSFVAWGFPLAVCARCLGIYAGLAIGWLGAPWLPALQTRQTRWLWYCVAPMLCDWMLDAMRWLPNTQASRLVTGFIAGCAVATLGWNIACQIIKENQRKYSGEELIHE